MRDMKEYYGCYFFDFAGGDESFDGFKRDSFPLKPSIGFTDIKEELLAIEATNEPLPVCLAEKPIFVFGAYTGGSSNHSLFKELKQSQKKIQDLLKKPDFLERILKKIGGKKTNILCKKTVSSNLHPSFFKETLPPETWNYIFDNVIHNFKKSQQKFAFINSLSNPFTFPLEVNLMSSALDSTIKGLKKACENLINANIYFKTISENALLQTMVPDLLYVKQIQEGSGKELKGSARVRVGYIITDAKENILFAHHDTWLSLFETIPGFAHGLQGMRVGGKREIFIHPSLAYGELTTLPPCTELIVKIHLLDIENCTHEKLPSLEPLDFSWIQNPKFHSYIEKSIEQKPLFIGSFYSNLLEKLEGSKKSTIIANLDEKVSAFKKDTFDIR